MNLRIKTCGGELDIDEVDFITSPGWPTQYVNSQECDWTVNVPDGVDVKLEFKEEDAFSIEAPDNGAQCYDTVLLTKLATDVTEKYCGNSFEQGFVDDSRIRQDPIIEFTGSFQIKFKVSRNNLSLTVLRK